MNIERLYSAARPRHRVWCLASELTAGQTDGTYTVNDAAVAAELGEGSEILVIDAPGRLLFWDSVGHLAYDWTGGGGA